MTRAGRMTAVCVSYALLLVLVCPEIPTPIYIGKDKVAGQHLQDVAPAAVAVLAPEPTNLFVDTPVHLDPRALCDSTVLLTCQRRC